MLKKLIIIENGNEYQCDTLEELVKMLIDENYYNMTQEQKNKKMMIKALANCMNNKMEVVNEKIYNSENSMDGKFVINDEYSYILSLLTTNNVLLLERKDAHIFIKDMDKEELKDNYIIVNTFAKNLLNKYVSKK